MKENERFYNRELSWLEFNSRVLEQAEDDTIPLFERLNFLSIVSSNLDEFYMVRVASVKDQIDAGYDRRDFCGNTPIETYFKLAERAHKMTDSQYQLYGELLDLAKNKVRFIKSADLDGNEKCFLKDYFEHTVFPVLTPMAVDRDRHFPLILNKSLNIGVMLKNEKDELLFANVQVPSLLDRLVKLPGKETRFILMEEIILYYLHKLFGGYKVICSACYRITRNADLAIDEEEVSDLLSELENSLKKRQWGKPIRLEISLSATSGMVSYLKEMLQIDNEGIFLIKGPLDITYLVKLKGYLPEYQTFIPYFQKELRGNIFENIRQKDFFVHHPYDSFEPVVEFIEQAARDESVLAIKQTLYRVCGDSSIIKALKRAAKNGKQVTVLVEIKARFDEQNNIQWAKELERAGCHVICGIRGLKTHCKITLVVKRDLDKIRRYVHMGTGNYNDITATQYTDMGYFTCNEEFGADATTIFNMLSGYYKPKHFYHLIYAPVQMKQKILELITQETENAKMNKKGSMILKMNSLVDKDVIQALYEASCKGVKIELIVRGICCLIPGIKGVSENITVRSIVGRFLEHSRIYYFYQNGNDAVYLSSADWMPRNLYNRIELMFPVRDEKIKKKMMRILNIMLKDTQNTSQMQSNCKYKKTKENGMDSQNYFIEQRGD